MDSSRLLEGWPFGGCAILFRNKLLPYITPLVSCSNRFCGLKIIDSGGVSYLFVSVYMPNAFQNTAISDYLSTLGELQSFITSHCCDVVLIVGDFNVDFDRRDQLCSILSEFMSENSLFACDLSFVSSVGYTYERHNCRSWINHILCSHSFASKVTRISSLKLGQILSDHLPLFFPYLLNVLVLWAPGLSANPHK